VQDLKGTVAQQQNQIDASLPGYRWLPELRQVTLFHAS
jgi:hypothetical protein